MKKLVIPKFDENLKFTGYKIVEVKEKIDYSEIAQELPGIPQGYCEEIHTIFETKKPIEITNFYDPRQGKGLRKIKGFYIAVM